MFRSYNISIEEKEEEIGLYTLSSTMLPSSTSLPPIKREREMYLGAIIKAIGLTQSSINLFLS